MSDRYHLFGGIQLRQSLVSIWSEPRYAESFAPRNGEVRGQTNCAALSELPELGLAREFNA